MNRRDFLKSFGFGTAALSLGGCRMFATGDNRNLTVFISDSHVHADSYRRDRLSEVIDSILAMDPLPRNVVHFGDIAFLRGPDEDYKASIPLYRRLTDAGIGLTFGMGNHDRRDNFLANFPEYRSRMLLKDRIVSEVDLGDADLIMLDTLHELDDSADERSRKNGWITDGQLKGEQMEWLAAEVKRRTRPFFLAAHHPIAEITDGDSNRINDLVMETSNCIGWIHGHDHVWRPGLLKHSSKGWFGSRELKRTLCLPSTGHWGDIGYVVFTTAPGSARAELRITDYYFPRPDASHPFDKDVVEEKRGAFMTFRWQG